MTITPKKDIIAVLRKAAQLFDKPESWCRGRLAVAINTAGQLVNTHACDPAACAWCADGALIRAAYGTYEHPYTTTYVVPTEHARAYRDACEVLRVYLGAKGLVSVHPDYVAHVAFNDRAARNGAHVAQVFLSCASELEGSDAS